MGKVGKGHLAKIISRRTGESESTVREILSQVFTAITEELARGHSVTIIGFGTWRTKVYTPRAGRHPQDGSEIEIPARTRVGFKAGTKLRARVEKSIDPEIFFGHGLAEATELEGVLANVFGANPETFHLEETTARIRSALAADFEAESGEFFTSLGTDPQERERPEAVDPEEAAADDADESAEEVRDEAADESDLAQHPDPGDRSD